MITLWAIWYACWRFFSDWWWTGDSREPKGDGETDIVRFNIVCHSSYTTLFKADNQMHWSLQGDRRWAIANAGTSVWQLHCPPWDLQKRSGEQEMSCFCMWPPYNCSDWKCLTPIQLLRLERSKRGRRSLTSRPPSFAPVRRGGKYFPEQDHSMRNTCYLWVILAVLPGMAWTIFSRAW